MDKLKIKQKSLELIDNNVAHCDPNIIINMIFLELDEVKKLEDVAIDVIDNNIFKLLVKIVPYNDELQTDLIILDTCIEIEINIHPSLYPFYPHTVKIHKPKFNNNLNYIISNLDYFDKNNWNPTNTLAYTISSIKSIIEKKASIKSAIYSNIELLFDELSNEVNIKPKIFDNIKIPFISLKANDQVKKDYLPQGTGYGTNSSSKWDIKKYINDKEQKENRILVILNNIYEFDNIDLDIINNSCFIPYLKYLLNVEILDLINQANIYLKIFNIINKYSIYNILDTNIQEKIYTIKELLLDYVNNLIKYNCDINDKEKELLDILTKISNNFIKSNDITDNNDFNQIQTCDFDKPNKVLSATTMRRIIKEIKSWNNSLPSTIFIRYDESNLNYYQFIIIGPEDTPYQYGCYHFELYLSENYPLNPPKVNFLTTGQGSVRFNPNLYQCGKVCLSLLGTWSGHESENWSPSTSTILQILISIQSLIFVDQPYFNEPGYVSQINTSNGKNSSLAYNQKIQENNIKWAMIDMIEKLPKYFEDVIINHFKINKDKIINMMNLWNISDNLKNKLSDKLITL